MTETTLETELVTEDAAQGIAKAVSKRHSIAPLRRGLTIHPQVPEASVGESGVAPREGRTNLRGRTFFRSGT